MVGKLSEEETVLLHAVAYWLRGEMLSRLADVSPATDLLHDLAQSNFEVSCGALERVGLLASEGDYWRVLEPICERPALAISNKRSDLDHLLDGVACHSHYVNDLHLHHESVTPSGSNLKSVCVAMVACGYMEATSDSVFEWTDSFGPWLVRRGAWDLDEFETAPQVEVNLVLAAIPDNAKERLEGSMCRHKPEFVRSFFARWVDGNWEEGKWRSAPSDDWDLNLAAGLYAQMHKK